MQEIVQRKIQIKIAKIARFGIYLRSINWCFIIVNNFFIPFCYTFNIPVNALKNFTIIKNG